MTTLRAFAVKLYTELLWYMAQEHGKVETATIQACVDYGRMAGFGDSLIKLDLCGVALVDAERAEDALFVNERNSH